jgi:hypothetical protein
MSGKEESSTGYQSDDSTISNDSCLRLLAPLIRSNAVRVPETPPKTPPSGRNAPLSDWQKSSLGSDWSDELLSRQKDGTWPAYDMAKYMEMAQNTWNRPKPPLPVPTVVEKPLPKVMAIPNKRLRESDQYEGHQPRLDPIGYELEIERLKTQNKRLRRESRDARNKNFNLLRHRAEVTVEFERILDEKEKIAVQYQQQSEALEEIQRQLLKLRSTIDLSNEEEADAAIATYIDLTDDEEKNETDQECDEFPLDAEYPKQISAEKMQ